MNNANAHKPGYKHTPLGWIPDGWQVKSLEECSVIKGEYGINAPAVEYMESLPTYIRITDIGGDGDFLESDKKSVDNVDANKYVLEQGDIVFARTGATVGKSYLHRTDRHLVFAGFLIRFRADNSILLPYFLKLSVSTKRYWDWVKVTSTRSGQPGINGTEYCTLPLLVPPISEQLKLMNVISAWDEAIQKTQQLIEQLKQRNKGLMQQLLTGKKRLKGFSGKWKQTQVRNIADEVGMKNKGSKELTVLSCTKYHGLVDSLEYFGRRVFSDDTSTYKVVPRAHFAYATNHIEEGSIGYQDRYDEALISPMYTVFKTRNGVNDAFLYKVLKSQHYIHEYQKRMEGSIDRRGGLRWDDFSKIPIQLPDIEEQTAIATVLDMADSELKLQEQQLTTLQEQKKRPNAEAAEWGGEGELLTNWLMWIAKKKHWHKTTTELDKFMIERILQRCDYSETITNKHRTSNGYTQLKELIHYCELTVKRSKTIKTLIVLLEEAKTPLFRQNVVSDYVIDVYFKDLQVFIKDYDGNKLLIDRGQPNLVVLQNLAHKLKLFEKQLDSYYYTALCTELKKINYSESKEVLRNAELISKLIDLLIPYLVFNGYSLATISEILRHWIVCNYPVTISKLLSFFHFNSRPFSFLQYIGIKNSDADDFLELMRNQLGVEVKEISASTMDADFLQQNNIPIESVFAHYVIKTLDPHMHVRSNYDNLLKKLVIQKERQSLEVFNNFFKNSLWHHKPNRLFKTYKSIALEGDPINVNARGRTLRYTLYRSSNAYSFDFSSEKIPSVDIEQLNNAIYYYNLALGSKSIENSLSLLWTALEAVQPYKVYSSDIEAVQILLSRGLAIGALSRDIYSFAVRFMQSNQQNDNSLDGLGTRYFDPVESSKGLISWFDWMRNKGTCENNFKVLKCSSELLAFQYLSTARPLIEKNQSFVLDRIKSSEASIKYQLQRIYSHRNKIVHSGDMINEYTNLWMHLEWYVGKILAYFITTIHYTKKYDSLEDAFMGLEADFNYLCSYLDRNKNEPVTNMSDRLIKLLFKHSWQAF